MTRNWNIVYDNSKSSYGAGNEIIYKTEVSKSSLCDYHNAYILVKVDIIVKATPETQVPFKNCAPFTKYITKIDETTIDCAEVLDLIMPMYNLLEHSSNYSRTIGSLWSYSQDGATNFNADIANDNNF